EGEHTGGDALEDGLHQAAALLQRNVGLRQVTGGGDDLPPGILQLRRHAIEGLHQASQFVSGTDGDAVIEAAARDFFRGRGQRLHGTSNELGEEQCEPGGGKEHEDGEQQQQPHVGAADQLALLRQLQVALLAGLNLLHGLRERGRQGQADQHPPARSDAGGSQRVINVVEGEGVGEWDNAARQLHGFAHHRPYFRQVEAGFGFAIEQRDGEAALQWGFIAAECVHYQAEVAGGKSALSFGIVGDGLGFGTGVVSRVVGEQRADGGGVLANLLDRPREPFVNRTVHQPVRKQEKENHGCKGECQRAHNHAGAEVRAENAAAAFGKQLEQGAQEHKAQGHQRQENQCRQRGEYKSLLAGGRAEERQIKRLLRENHGEQQEQDDGQNNNEG